MPEKLFINYYMTFYLKNFVPTSLEVSKSIHISRNIRSLISHILLGMTGLNMHVTLYNSQNPTYESPTSNTILSVA